MSAPHCRWQGFGDGVGTWESTCRLRIYEEPEQAVIIATELPEHTGTSITNAAKHLATMVVEQYGPAGAFKQKPTVSPARKLATGP